jgi:hypothetical protein
MVLTAAERASVRTAPAWSVIRRSKSTASSAFGKDRCTKYRLIYGGTEGIRKVPDKEEWHLKPDSEGNEAD